MSPTASLGGPQLGCGLTEHERGPANESETKINTEELLEQAQGFVLDPGLPAHQSISDWLSGIIAGGLLPAGSKLPAERQCECGHALRDAVITNPAAIPDRVKRDLAPLIGKYIPAAPAKKPRVKKAARRKTR